MEFHCTNCRLAYPENGVPYRCPRCGGIFDADGPLVFKPGEVDVDAPGIWRYRHTFGLPDSAPSISLGEGCTPLSWTMFGDRQVGLKCEFLNPSGSFKDRGSAIIASFLKGRGVSAAIEDSSGNAGASFAAYAARAGITAKIFIPDSASGPKRKQIEAYGADVVRVMGPRSNASEAVRRSAEQGETYASHAYLPFNLAGYATAAYELVEQLKTAPGMVIVPAGQGGFLLGMLRGFEAMLNAGVIERMPVMVGVQARACAPLWALNSYGPAGLSWAAEAPTIAEGIRVLTPLRGDAVLSGLARYRGTLVAVDEDDIVRAHGELARRGFLVEPTSATAWAALEMMDGQIVDPVVMVLTGNGLKAI